MADVFISYAREDRAVVAVLVECLEASGFSVFWDNNIGSGEHWDERTEYELETAKCVIVVWSNASVKSRWVKAEAHAAAERDVLLPVIIDSVKPPLRFSLIQYEDLREWNGDRLNEAWRRLEFQIKALVSAPLSTHLWRHDHLALQAPSEALPRRRTSISIKTGRWFRDWTRRFLSFILAAVVAAAFAGLAAAGTIAIYNVDVLEAKSNLGFIVGSGIGFTFFFLWLFAFGWRQLAPHKMAMVRQWLLPVKDGPRIRAQEAFLLLFEAAFGRRHLSFKCLWRSTMTSFLFLMAVVLITSVAFAASNGWTIDSVRTKEVKVDKFFFEIWKPDKKDVVQITYAKDTSFKTALKNVENFLASPVSLLTAFGLSWINIIADYLSLFETRLFLRFLRRRPGWTLPVLPLDFALTFLVFMLVVWASGYYLLGDELTNPLTRLSAFLQEDYRPEDITKIFEPGDTKIIAPWAMLATTFMTSVWLLLTILFGPISRLLFWRREGEPNFLGRALGIKTQPFRALSAVTLAVVLFVLAAAVFGLGLMQPDTQSPL